MGNLIVRSITAYPILQKRFNKYFEGINVPPGGWSRQRLFWDYIKVRHIHPELRIAISEYFIYEFYRRDAAGKLSFLTDTQATLRMRPYNEQAKELLWHKDRFLDLFSDFIHRDWLRVQDVDAAALRDFTRRHGSVALKPSSSSWGIGFKRLDACDVTDWEELRESLLEKDYIAEAFIRPAAELARFHPASLNTLRIITFRNGERFGVFGAGLRVGNNGKSVDNAHSGGIFCEIDIESGVVMTDGLDEWGNRYLAHPMTNEVFRGSQIPRWREVIDLCKRASAHLPCLRIVGWDVAILDDGSLELIEGNHNPGMHIVQGPAGRGVRARFDEMLHDFFGSLEGGAVP